MTALPDQAANAPLLNDSTKQHLDILTPKSSHPSKSNVSSSEGKPNDAHQSLFPDDRFRLIASIVGGGVIGVMLAVGHHTFLYYLHGQNIDDYSQEWIKGSNNGFSNIFSIFVGLSAGSALTQIKWRACGSEPLQVYTIDNLFALPAPLVLLKALMRPRGSLFLPILSSVFIQALVLVSILAPSALTVAPSQQVPRDIEVPIFNLTSQGQFAITSMIGDNPVVFLNLTTLGQERINSVLLDLPEILFAIPQDCGLQCTFHFEYNAPGMECQDVIPDDRPADFTNTYQATTNVGPRQYSVPISPIQQIDEPPYDLSINYTTVTNGVFPNGTLGPRAGTYCRFYNATYNASFELNSNGSAQRASASIIHHGDYLSWEKTVSQLESIEYQEGFASWAICYAFALAFQGNFSVGDDISLTNPVLAPIFNWNPSTLSFNLAVSNLSQTMVDLFSNLTLVLLSTRGDQYPVIMNGTVWDGSSVWIYTPWILWAVYLPAVVLATVVALYGLYTIHLSGIAMDDKFSSFLLATQDAELSEMCKKASAFDELRRLQLIHEKNGTFVVVDSNLKSVN